MNLAGSRAGVTVLAPAKLTLSLRITGVRDDGYHLLDAEMVTVDLCDRLEIGPGDALSVEVDPDVVLGSDWLGEVPVDGSNLVRQALAAVGRRAAVRLVKRIPPGAGLGGGSADAAAVLRWAGCADLDLAARLGADVAFCVLGGRARVRGVGELVEPLPTLGRSFTLGLVPVACSTPAVYRAWDELGGPQGPGSNDLETAALAVEPGLARWRDRLGEATGETPALAGSGSTWFVPGAHPGEGRVVVREVAAGA